jgi:hypothetical protein
LFGIIISLSIAFTPFWFAVVVPTLHFTVPFSSGTQLAGFVVM